jgi:hypothetical protein
MSVPDVATLINIRGRVPSVVSAQSPGVLVRWMLRLATLVIFGVATVIGVQLGLTAPAESPVSISEPRR